MSENQSTPRASRTREAAPAVSDELLARIVEATEQRIATRPNPMALNSFEEIEAFAERAARSQMVPKDYAGKPDNIILAVMQGKELGLPPIQAIQSIAMVNGRPSVWGDAVPGLCYASRLLEDHEEFYEGTEGQDNYTAVCKVKRKGVASTKEGRFSQGDAKKAGLFGQAVHGKYPKDMAMWRARHRAFHAAFPDVLRGIGTREIEAEDAVATPGWTMPVPEKGWFASKPQARSDGWDDTWFNGVVQKLAGEPNAWKWLDLLAGCLTDAPTLRDVEEIDDLPMVAKVRETAPQDALTAINDAFAKARARCAEKPKDPVKPSHPVETQTTAPSGAAQPSAPAAPVQTAGDANKAPAVTTLPAFSQFLVDSEGYILPDETGEDRKAYTDPVAFAHAYVEAESNEFPDTLELFRRANHDARQLAMAASNKVAAILVPKPVAPVQQAPQTRQETSPSLPMEMPVDPLFVTAPTSKARPEMVRYNDALTAMLAKATTDAEVDRVMAVNAPTYDGFADPLRLKALGLGVARKKELTPPPARGAPVQTMNGLAAQLEHDIYSLVAPESCAAWLGMPGTKTALDRLMDGAPDLHDRVMKNLEAKHQALVASAATVRTPRQILNDVMGRMRACSTSEEAVALIYRPDHIADTQALTPELIAELKAVAVALDNERPEVWGPVKAIYAAGKQKTEAA